jgi:two-component system chemotaxis response regulator CheB
MTTPTRKIDVLVVEDSPVAQLLLIHILNSDARLNVLGSVQSGEEALEFLRRHVPQVIVMDIHLPGINGYETTRRIMESQPAPIVICSGSVNPSEVADTFHALEAGAVALVAKPVGPGHADYEATAARLADTVALMSEVKVVKRWTRARRASGAAPAPVVAETLPQLVAIGTSTGGPPVLHTILAGLPRNFPLPILIVQHIATGFLPGLVEWLAQSTGFPVGIAEHGEALQPGRAYLAPDGHHLGVGAGGRVLLSRQEPENGVRPAVSFLFRSVAAFAGARALAVLLTGMGRDGADELKRLRDLGAATIVQDAESSVIHGMPGAAIKLDAASYVLPPEKIPAALVTLATSNSREPWPRPNFI